MLDSQKDHPSIAHRDSNISIKDDNKYDTSSVSSARQTIDSDAETVKGDTDTASNDDFDWYDDGPEEAREKEKIHNERSCFLCLDRKSSTASWTVYIILTLISVGVCVGVYVAVKPQQDPTMKSYNLCLWFTFVAFMFCISFVTQCFIELIPWLCKKFVYTLVPRKSEITRARLSYYMALRSYIKLVVMGAWAWGSWAFIRRHIDKPSRPIYVKTLEYVWECVFLLTVFLFVEKFILQLIVTSFHKKAYGDRLMQNERALKILDKLKRVKRSNAQDLLLRPFRRHKEPREPDVSKQRNDKYAVEESEYVYRPDDYKNLGKSKPIINTKTEAPLNQDGEKQNVRFPTSNMDTLIAIPPLASRSNSDETSNNLPLDNETRDNLAYDDDGDDGSPTTNNSSRRPSLIDGIRKTISRKKPKKSTRELDNDLEEKDEIRESNRLDEFDKKQQFYNHHDERGTTTSSKSKKKHKQIQRSNTSVSSISLSSLEEKSFLKFGYERLFKESTLSQDPVYQAKILAKQIYHNIMGPNPVRQYVVESDMYDFFKTHKDAKEAFKLFDTDSNGDISRKEMRAGCVRIYCERKDLARSMRDMSQATGKLDIILIIVFLCIWAIVVMAVFGVNIGTQLMPLWSAFIAASFIFGNSAKDAFESIIFVFVTHPFDTGDRILIGAENWTVANVGLSVSTFLKWDGSVIYAKNSVLATQYIINCRRTGRTSESLDIQVSYHTPSWKIHELREHMVKWANKYPKLFTPNSTGANIVSLENLNRITLTFFFEHTKNFQDSGGRWLRHNNFMLELKDELQRLNITYTKPDQPVTHRYLKDEIEDLQDEQCMYDDSERKKWKKQYNSTSRYQNHAGTSESQGGEGVDADSGGPDSGAAAGAAATVAFSTAML